MRRWRHRCVTHQGNLVAVVELQRRQERALLGRRARGIGLERGADRVHVVAEPRGLLASCVLWGEQEGGCPAPWGLATNVVVV